MTPQEELDAMAGCLCWHLLKVHGMVEGDDVDVQTASKAFERLAMEGYKPTPGSGALFCAEMLREGGMDFDDAVEAMRELVPIALAEEADDPKMGWDIPLREALYGNGD